MTALNHNTTVGQCVAEQPALAPVFERLGIDYCCGGQKPLAQACAEKGLDPDTVLRTLAAVQNAPAADSHGRWLQATMSQLVDHIITAHHDYLRTELPRVEGLLTKIAGVHGANHPALHEVREIFQEFRAELEQHMAKEERILFPMIRQLESSTSAPNFHCGSLANPIRVMIFEHDNAGNALERLRALTDGYSTPADACNTYRATMDALRRIEEDMHQHVHEENNILFPKAIRAEAALAA